MANQFRTVKMVGTKVTGSISKILALGADDAEPHVERIEFGNFITPEINFTASSVETNFNVPAGTYIDGPIGRVSGSNFLVYINN